MRATVNRDTLLQALRASDLSMQLKCALRTVADHAGVSGNGKDGQGANMAMATFADECSCSVRHARRLLAELVRLGWLTLVPHEGLTNSYYLRLPGDTPSDGLSTTPAMGVRGALDMGVRPPRTSGAPTPDTGVPNPGHGCPPKIIKGSKVPSGATAPPTPARTLVTEYINNHSDVRPPNDFLGQLGKSVGRLLDQGYDPVVVRAGITRWHEKGLRHPSALASVVDEVINPPPARRPALPGRDWLALDDPRSRPPLVHDVLHRAACPHGWPGGAERTSAGTPRCPECRSLATTPGRALALTTAASGASA